MSHTISFATVHSLDRAKERTGLNEKNAVKQIDLALRRGKSAESFTSWERSFLTREANDNCTALAYDGFCYIVNENGFCVTMYPLPAWFGKKKHFSGKERIRNMKTYSRLHSSDLYE